MSHWPMTGPRDYSSVCSRFLGNCRIHRSPALVVPLSCKCNHNRSSITVFSFMEHRAIWPPVPAQAHSNRLLVPTREGPLITGSGTVQDKTRTPSEIQFFSTVQILCPSHSLLRIPPSRFERQDWLLVCVVSCDSCLLFLHPRESTRNRIQIALARVS